MNKLFKNLLIPIINPFFGSGIGNYRPFSLLHKFVMKGLSKEKGGYVTNFGARMNLDGEKLIDSYIIRTGYWEKRIQHLIQKYLRKGETFLDIGANIGYFTLLASKIVGEKGKVIALEPALSNFEELENNIKLNINNGYIY